MSEISDSDEEVYSYTTSKTVYKRSRSRPSTAAGIEPDFRSHKVYTNSDVAEQSTSEYRPVARWAVDYNNRNYVRSLCNKNQGFHRKLKGRPLKYKIHYDNNFFTRSKVNEPKGLHRKIPEIKRKYVPEDDDLADATGWEFDYGPEYAQIEQDVNYIPEGRIIRRGCYRWYGVKRNDSDYDLKLDEERENLLNEELEEELKYGHEFLQSDIPYMEEQKNRHYSRGGYRFFETLRNVHDFQPEELAEANRDPEWRRKYHCNGVRYLDLERCLCEREDDPEHRFHTKKGKPFRRTILNKVYELRKEDSSKDLKRHATRLSLIPGESRQSLYEGIPDRIRYGMTRSPGIRSVFKTKRDKYMTNRDEDYEEYEKEDVKQSYSELKSSHERRQHRKDETRSGRRRSLDDLARNENRSRDEYVQDIYSVKQADNGMPRRRLVKGSAEDVRENYETWKENTFYNDEEDRIGRPIGEKKSKDRRNENTYQERDYIEKDRPRRRTVKGSDEDVRENYETWKENTVYKKEEGKGGPPIAEKKSKDRRNENIYQERDYPLKDFAVERRENKEKRYDRDEHPLQSPMSELRERLHGNEIRKQKETRRVKEERRDRDYRGTPLQNISNRGKSIRDPRVRDADLPLVSKAKGKTRDRDYVDTHKQNFNNRGKSTRVADKYEADLPPVIKTKGRSKDRDYADTHKKNISNRGKVIRLADTLEKDLTPGKEEVSKKMPPHVEERLRNIRERMERKLKLADHKHKDKRDGGAFPESSSDEFIDLMKHKGHPNDTGESHNSEYEKYISENGSEIFVKKNEKYAELHHKNYR